MAKKTIINKIESSKLDLIDNPEEKLLNKVETAITNTLPSEELETVSAVEDKEPIKIKNLLSILKKKILK